MIVSLLILALTYGVLFIVPSLSAAYFSWVSIWGIHFLVAIQIHRRQIIKKIPHKLRDILLIGAWGLPLIHYFLNDSELQLTSIPFYGPLVIYLLTWLRLDEKKFFPKEEKKVIKFKFDLKEFVAISGVIGIFLFFGLSHLGQFMSVDEPKWVINRVPQLIQAIETGRWNETYINDKPGLLPALFSMPVYFFHGDFLSLEYQDTPIFLFLWRVPVVLLNAFMLYILYYIIRSGWGRRVAYLGLILIALSPVTLGVSQIVNPDATLWTTSIITWILLFRYLETGLRRYLWMASFWMGLALISKFFAALILIFFPGVILYQYWVKKHMTITDLKQKYRDWIFFTFASVIWFGLFFPATWSNSSLLWRGSLGSGLISPLIPLLLLGGIVLTLLLVREGALNQYLKQRIHVQKIIPYVVYGVVLFGGMYMILYLFFGERLLDFNDFQFEFERGDASQYIGILQANVITTFLTQPLTIVLGVGAAILANILHSRPQKYIIFSLVGFTIFFLLGTGSGGYIANARYQIMLYPIFGFITALLIGQLGLNKNRFLTLVGIVFIYHVFLLGSSPFYYHYTNALNFRNAVVTESWGYGGYEVAQYLNQKENIDNLNIWHDREGAYEFTGGTNYWRGSSNPFDPILEIDYLILSWGGENIFRKGYCGQECDESGTSLIEQVSNTTPILEYYQKEPEFQICLRNNPNNCVRVVKVVD